MHSSCSFFGGKRNDTIRRNVRCAHRFDRTKFSSNRYTIHDRQAHFFAYLYLNVQRWDATRCDVMLRARWWNSLISFSMCVCVFCTALTSVERPTNRMKQQKKQTLKTTLSLLLWSLVWFLMDFCIMLYVFCRIEMCSMQMESQTIDLTMFAMCVFESMCVDCTLFLSNVKILPDHIISVWPSNLFILAPAVCLYLSSCGQNYIFGKPLEPRAKATFG